MTHLTEDQAARWVAGVLDEEEDRLVEAHSRSCRACEALLAAEARVDATLSQAIAQLPAARPRLAARFIAIAVPLALAAALLLVTLGAPAPGELIPDGGISNNVPRYELDVEVPREALSALEPAGL